MPEQLTIYSCVPKGYNASIYYRLELPLQTAEDMGLDVFPILDNMDPAVSPQQRMAALYESDVCLFYQPVGAGLVDHMRQMDQMIPCKRNEQWKWPPSVVVDTDDNLFDVNPMNGAFKDLGIRMPDGQMLKEGDEIGVEDRAGNKQVLYRDGFNGFSVKANQEKLGVYRSILNAADAVTCSTPRSEGYVKTETEAKRTFVTPNCIRLDHYEPIDLAPHPGKVRIMWQGSPTHHEDWFPLRNAMGYLTRRYPEIEWVIWGVLYPWVMELVPSDRYQHIKWTPYQLYKLRLCTIGHDINLAPLSNTRFNLCRSAIKFYESSILKNPAATVAQRTGPYADELIDGETALLFDSPDQFIEKVSLLVENERERKRIAANAKDWTLQNRDAFKVVPRLVEFWRELRAEKRRQKPPDEAAWLALRAEMEQWAREDKEREVSQAADAEQMAKELAET